MWYKTCLDASGRLPVLCLVGITEPGGAPWLAASRPPPEPKQLSLRAGREPSSHCRSQTYDARGIVGILSYIRRMYLLQNLQPPGSHNNLQEYVTPGGRLASA